MAGVETEAQEASEEGVEGEEGAVVILMALSRVSSLLGVYLILGSVRISLGMITNCSGGRRAPLEVHLSCNIERAEKSMLMASWPSWTSRSTKSLYASVEVLSIISQYFSTISEK